MDTRDTTDTGKLIWNTAISAFFIMFFLPSAIAADGAGLRLIDGYLVVTATLNESHNGQFLLDTGADATVISPVVANLLDLEPTTYVEAGVAGGNTIRVPFTELQSVSIGRHSVPLETVIILDVSELMEEAFADIDGIIGSDFLRHFTSTIDLVEKRLQFETPETLAKRLEHGVKIPAEIVDGTAIFLPVRLNGRLNGRYKLDTGAAVTHLTLADATRLGMTSEAEGVRVDKSEGIGGSYDVLLFDLREFEVGAASPVEHLPVKAYETAYGFIGADFLQHFNLTLNYADEFIVLSTP